MITAVDNESKLDKMLTLSADHVIDFNKEDFTKNGLQYDFILDAVATHPIPDYKRALAPGGSYRMVGGRTKRIIQLMVGAPFMNMGSNKKLGILAHKPNKNLDVLIELFEQGKVRPIIDRTFPLEETQDAFRYFAKNEFFGKVVILVNA